ncbi:MAG: hypothetical protein IMW89_08665 [Ktedonobacteraceae bacterium]|nr:hypothetical protein [Ktedonobacteraceae bacterium]
MERISIPAIYCPFPSRISPHAEILHEHSLAWATRFHLVQREAAMRRFLASRFARLTARVYPTAGLEELQLLNDWLVWLFMFDDQFDDGLLGRQPEHIETVLNAYLAIFINPDSATPADPAAEALLDLYRRTFPRMPAVWQERYRQHFIKYFDTYNWTVRNRALGIVPDIASYVEKRRHSGGMTIGIDLIDFAEHIELPEQLLNSPQFEILNRTTNDVVCWSNDIISLEKERARGDVNNLVVVVQHAYGLTLQQAIDHVNALVTAQARLFEETERQLPAFAPELAPKVQKYLDGLKAWMRGNLDWSGETHRYSHVEHTASGQAVSYLDPILIIKPVIEM